MRKVNSYKTLIKLILIVAASLLLTISAVQAESTPNRFEVDEISIELKRTKRDETSILKLEIAAKTEPEVELFSLTSPSRIVIDLKNISISRPHFITPSEASAIKRIRLGAHPNRVRIVLDFDSQSVPEFRATQRPFGITVDIVEESTSERQTLPATTVTPLQTAIPSITKIEEQATATATAKQQEAGPALIDRGRITKPIKTPTAAPQYPKPATATPLLTAVAIATATVFPTATVTPSSTPSATSTGTTTPLSSPTASPARTPTPERKTVEQKAVLEDKKAALIDLSFEKDPKDGQPAVRLRLNRRLEFQVRKQGEDRYHVSISNCRLAFKRLSLPQFAPQSFVGLTMATADSKGDGLLITIGVERGAKITYFAVGNEIWIKSLTEAKEKS